MVSISKGHKTKDGDGPKTHDKMNVTDSTASNVVVFIKAWMIPRVSPFSISLFF
jgi:hypothetical protein